MHNVGHSESHVWQTLKHIIDRGESVDERIFHQLDECMQGYLFLQEHIVHREARIAFARNPAHMIYLRDAAGSRHVWMDDEAFTGLVDLNDSVTLACFARSVQMKPHHLALIEFRLKHQPHGQELLANASDTRITLKKSIELHGLAADLTRLKTLFAESESTDSREIWQKFLLARSTPRPVLTSGKKRRSVH